MTHDALDLEGLGNDLQTVLPHLQIARPLHLLGSGFNSLVLETSQGMVFRVAKNRDATEGQTKEARLLPFLQTRLPVAVPAPQYYISPCKQFPFGVIGYPKIDGVALQPQFLCEQSQASLAEACAGFLYALHALPLDETSQLGIPSPLTFWARLKRLRLDVLPVLQDTLSVLEYSQMERWWDAFLADSTLRQVTPCLCHGDLWYENILVDAAHKAVTGIVDFEDTVIADPAQDFATLLSLGKPFTIAVIEAYRAHGATLTESLAYRIEHYWEVRDFGGLQFAVKHTDQEELTDALRKLRQGPILHPEMRF
jgi:aminoglycoside 2''-phosphotransferase